MAHPIIVRAARTDEAASLAAAHIAADWETYAPLFGAKAWRLDEAETLDRWASGLRDCDIVLAALDGMEVIGVAHIAGDHLRALYLMASYHRQGVGSHLLATSLAEARARGVGTMRLTVVETNHRAVAFYEAMGGRRVGRSLHGDRGDSWWEFDYVFDN